MQIWFRRLRAHMAEQGLNLVEHRPRVGQIAGEPVASLMRRDSPRQVGPSTQRGEQFVDRPDAHRCTQRLPKQVDQQEVAVRRRGLCVAFEEVEVNGANGEEVQGNRSLPAGFRPCTVRIYPAHHMQVCTR